MHNLLSNALKYTPKGGHIYITATQENNNLVIQIADSGKGIDKQDLPHIFETFYQGNNSCMDMGTGVGLSLAKQMVETMSGQITVKSAVGKGTVFFVTLPLKHGTSQWEEWTPDEPEKNLPPSVPTPDPASSETEPSGADPATILLVEDNQDVAFYIGGLLKERYRLLYARDGKEGLEKAAEYMPDLILTDLMMPGMDGFELWTRCRGSKPERTPICSNPSTRTNSMCALPSCWNNEGFCEKNIRKLCVIIAPTPSSYFLPIRLSSID